LKIRPLGFFGRRDIGDGDVFWGVENFEKGYEENGENVQDKGKKRKDKEKLNLKG
jgi:hypothetical protein